MSEYNNGNPPPIPDHNALGPDRFSNRSKRIMFVVLMIILTVTVFAGMFTGGPKATPTQSQLRTQQGTSIGEIAAKEDSILKQFEEANAKAKQIDAKAKQIEESQRRYTAGDMERDAAMRDALERQQQGMSGNGAPNDATTQAQRAEQKRDRAYKALFADNFVRQEWSPMNQGQQPQPEPQHVDPQWQTPNQVRPIADSRRESSDTGEARDTSQAKRQPLDFVPSAEDYLLPEGTIIEGVLTNRLAGEQPAPVNTMVTTNVYVPGTSKIVIPQGARVIGDAKAVSNYGQRRLAVTFHRIMVDGNAIRKTYGIPLDMQPIGLGQGGDGGLPGKVNNHYLSIFGASLAVGAIGGLAQIGNSYGGYGYDSGVAFRNGVSQSMGQSAMHVLDRFLNQLPTITIPEGTRVKIMLTGDIPVPSYNKEG